VPPHRGSGLAVVSLSQDDEIGPGYCLTSGFDHRGTRRWGSESADIIALLAGELRSRGITLALARVQRTILELWTRAGAIDALGPHRVFDTVREAVRGLEKDPAGTAVEGQTAR
jgi:MFS superfamily sulfate permease-like transporter